MSRSDKKRNFYLQFIPAILASIALLIGTAGNLQCQTVSFSQDNTGDGKIYSGVFHYRTDGFDESSWCSNVCKTFNSEFDYDADRSWMVAKVFSIITPIVGGIAIVLSALFPCGNYDIVYWRWITFAFFFSSVGQGLSLFIINSSACDSGNPVLEYLEEQRPEMRTTFSVEPQCKWEAGIKMSIAAVIFWFLAGLYAFLRPAVDQYPPPRVHSQVVTYERSANGEIKKTNVAITYDDEHTGKSQSGIPVQRSA